MFFTRSCFSQNHVKVSWFSWIYSGYGWTESYCMPTMAIIISWHGTGTDWHSCSRHQSNITPGLLAAKLNDKQWNNLTDNGYETPSITWPAHIVRSTFVHQLVAPSIEGDWTCQSSSSDEQCKPLTYSVAHTSNNDANQCCARTTRTFIQDEPDFRKVLYFATAWHPHWSATSFLNGAMGPHQYAIGANNFSHLYRLADAAVSPLFTMQGQDLVLKRRGTRAVIFFSKDQGCETIFLCSNY